MSCRVASVCDELGHTRRQGGGQKKSGTTTTSFRTAVVGMYQYHTTVTCTINESAPNLWYKTEEVVTAEVVIGNLIKYWMNSIENCCTGSRVRPIANSSQLVSQVSVEDADGESGVFWLSPRLARCVGRRGNTVDDDMLACDVVNYLRNRP